MTVDTEHCPTCKQPLGVPPCGIAWPASLYDVVILRCELPRGHLSAEHWHRPLWRGTDDLVWVLEADEERVRP